METQPPRPTRKPGLSIRTFPHEKAAIDAAFRAARQLEPKLTLSEWVRRKASEIPAEGAK